MISKKKLCIMGSQPTKLSCRVIFLIQRIANEFEILFYLVPGFHEADFPGVTEQRTYKDVLKCGEFRKRVYKLECLSNPQLTYFIGAQVCYIPSVEYDRTRAGGIDATDDIQER